VCVCSVKPRSRSVLHHYTALTHSASNITVLANQHPHLAELLL